MLDAMIADLLDQYFDLDEHLPALIESQLKCLAGLPAETPINLSA